MRKIGIFFIHGLGGTSKDTWKDFPRLLESDPELTGKIEIDSYEFPTIRLLSFDVFSKRPPVEDLVAELRSNLRNSFSSCEEIILVCHSLGGLVAQQYLLEEKKFGRPSKVRNLLMYATPHRGSSIASLLATFSVIPKQIKSLATDSDFLVNLEKGWSDNTMLQSVRTIGVVGRQDSIVNEDSAGATCQDIEFVNEGHLSIVKPTSLNDTSYKILKKLILAPESELSNIKSNVAKLAESVISHKAAVIRRTNFVPEMITRRVYLQSKDIRPTKTAAGELQLTEKYPVEFEKALKKSNLNFLFGEMGSGKSTLLAEQCKNMSQSKDDILPFFIKADRFKNEDVIDKDKLEAILDSLLTELLNKDPLYEFTHLLKRGINCTIFIDGFDEISFVNSSQLLSALEVLAGKYPSVNVVASGRPIELSGLNYAMWQLLEIETLSSNDKEKILYNEAIAFGIEPEKAYTVAKEKSNILRRDPEINAIATTPLMVRLLFNDLGQDISTETIGSILYKLLSKHLGEWDSVNSHAEPLAVFKKQYPTPVSREPIIAAIANKIHFTQGAILSRAGLYEALSMLTPDHVQKDLLVEETKTFLERNILSKEGESYSFISYPLRQCAVGLYYYLEILKPEQDNFVLPDRANWREFSFACGIARVKENSHKLYPKAKDYISTLLADRYLTYETAQIVIETKSTELARHVLVDCLLSLRLRPISVPSNNAAEWANEFASLFVMLGDEGFAWLYYNYLDPRYPLISYEWDTIENIFAAWAQLVSFNVSAMQRGLLQEMVEYHKAYYSHWSENILEISSLLIPESFETEENIRHAISLVRKNMLADFAQVKIQEHYITAKELVQNELLSLSRKNEHSNNRLFKCWEALEINEYPPEIVSLSIIDISEEELGATLTELQSKLGRDRLEGVLKWLCISGGKQSAHAAIALYTLNNRDLFLLGNALNEGLHDGGKIDQAEILLGSLIKKEGAKGVQWLLRYVEISNTSNVHSSHWRILLTELLQSEADYSTNLLFILNKLDEFALSRYPDIRDLFKDLLNKKPMYAEALQKGKHSIDRLRKFNSHCIAVVIDPYNNSEDLSFLIKGVERHNRHDEFYRFLLKLRFNRDYLKTLSKGVTLSEISNVYLHLILYHNKIYLNNEEKTFLIKSILGKYSSLNHSMTFLPDNLPNILEEDQSYQILKELLSDPKHRKDASYNLLRHFYVKLSDQEKLLYMLLNIEEVPSRFDFWKVDEIQKFVRNLDKNILDFTKNEDIKNSLESNKVVRELLAPCYDETVWSDFLWSAYSGNHHLHESDALTQYIFDTIRNDTNLKALIGSISLNIITDERWKDRRINDDYYMTVLIANECGSLGSAEISRFIPSHSNRDGYNGATDTVRALKNRASIIDDPTNIPDSENTYKKALVEDVSVLKDIFRDELGIHPQVESALEELLIDPTNIDQKLDTLISFGFSGRIVSTIIRFCQSRHDFNLLVKVNLEVSSRNLDTTPVATKLKKAIKYIRQTCLWSEEHRESYLNAVYNNALTDRELRLYDEVIANDSDLSDDFIVSICSWMKESDYWFPTWFMHSFCKLVISAKGNQRQLLYDEVLNGSERLFSIYDEYDDRRTYSSFWCFALARAFYLNKPDHISCSLFLTSMRVGFTYRTSNAVSYSPIRDLVFVNFLEETDKLFELLPDQIINDFLNQGLRSDDDEVRVLCKFIRAFTDKDLI